jgi:hypothetical protein
VEGSDGLSGIGSCGSSFGGFIARISFRTFGDFIGSSSHFEQM